MFQRTTVAATAPSAICTMNVPRTAHPEREQSPAERAGVVVAAWERSQAAIIVLWCLPDYDTIRHNRHGMLGHPQTISELMPALLIFPSDFPRRAIVREGVKKIVLIRLSIQKKK